MDWRKLCLTLWTGTRDLKYRFRGDFIEKDDQKVILFQLDEPEMVKTTDCPSNLKRNSGINLKRKSQGGQLSRTIYILPPEWENTFKTDYQASQRLIYWSRDMFIGMFCDQQKELAEYSALTSEDLKNFYMKQLQIIERWPIPDEHGTGKSTDDGTEESADAATECGTDVGAGAEENGDYAHLTLIYDVIKYLWELYTYPDPEGDTFNTVCIAGLEAWCISTLCLTAN